jgi:transketolase N-terminal domain/subunit/transketolase C-terminal domain/subunit
MHDRLTTSAQGRSASRDLAATGDYFLRQGILKLLAIKDSDIRILTLEQCRDAADKGIHAGGAFSATIPLVSLFYGGFIDLDIADPTRRGQDMFVLSKGHAVAALASIYADLGYFDRAVLRNSRSYESNLNGHPGPVLPGVHIATGPMGQGLSVAQGFALAGQSSPRFDCYCMVGDGELQEGPIWEAVMYSGQKNLDNFCVMVDQNYGQLDMANRMIFPTPDLEPVFRAFGWSVCTVDATHYDGVFSALEQFRYGPRNGKPVAIVCQGMKGQGAFSDFLNRHKVVIADNLMEQELALQAAQRRARVDEFSAFCHGLERHQEGARAQEALLEIARRMHLDVVRDSWGGLAIAASAGPVLTQRVPPRDKRISYDAALLPRIDRNREYSAADIVIGAMKVFARDPRVVSIDSDLASTSGLEAGVAAVDQRRALNVGVAEANMMNIGEAFAALGYNTWISTFCPFFDWKVLRRIAVGHQERLEAMEAPDGWLSEGHGLDLTLLATAADFETRTNGATHMGNDDITIFDGMGHLRIVSVSCPQQLLAIMKWIMAGNRGLVYVRVMRAPSRVLYGSDFEFEFGKGWFVRGGAGDAAFIVSSGRGVHEALAAAEDCAPHGLSVGVVDMPSVDEELLLTLLDSGKPLCFAEQNNGYLWQNFLKTAYRHRRWQNMDHVFTVNTLDAYGRPRFIHSGTYEQLLSAFGLAPFQLAETIRGRLAAGA